jgi:hypothetical protein
MSWQLRCEMLLPPNTVYSFEVRSRCKKAQFGAMCISRTYPWTLLKPKSYSGIADGSLKPGHLKSSLLHLQCNLFQEKVT